MPTLITDAERNADANRAAGQITHLSLHTASTGLVGDFEASGGSPLYARKAVAFNEAGAVGPMGASTQPATVGLAWSSQVFFDVPSGVYTHWGAWNSEVLGVFKRGNILDSPYTFSQQNVVSLSIGIGPYSGAGV